MKQVRLKLFFKKFFKRIWMPKFEKSRALRKVCQKIEWRDKQWERTRYQREFTRMHESFTKWKGFVEAHRELVQELEALKFYRQSLLIKALTKMVKWYRYNKGSGILRNLTLSS